MTDDLRLPFGKLPDLADTRHPDRSTDQYVPVRIAEPPGATVAAEGPASAEGVRLVEGLTPIEPADSAAQTLWNGEAAPMFSYLAGAAGSGKTFLAKQWADESTGVELVATTGIAAINLGGTTINALLGYFDTKSLQEKYVSGALTAQLGRLWRSGVKQIVVDEVSMLDGDQLTFLKRAVEEVNTKDYVLSSKAMQEFIDEFGTPQMKLMLVGDFAQLPPVEGPFAFESEEWRDFEAATKTLTAIRRQADPEFIEALRAARKGEAGPVLAYFGGGLKTTIDDHFDGTTLFAKNASVDRYNRLRLDQLGGAPILFENRRDGEQRSEWGNPNKPKETWGIPERLYLKAGALVMVLANRRVELSRAYHYVNGDLGTIEDQDDSVAKVRLHRTGEVEDVQYVRREKLIPIDAGRRKELRESGQQHRITENGKYEITGWIEYMPLRVAYGSTVHKSQGLSLDQVQISLNDHFFKTAGMLYVALSRARTAQGLRLVGSSRMLAERCTVNPALVGRFL